MSAPVCPLCGGMGSVTIFESVCTNVVSREMAQDAGEPSMEGMPWFEEIEIESPCAMCGGARVCERREGERRVTADRRFPYQMVPSPQYNRRRAFSDRRVGDRRNSRASGEGE